jgi:hypothetical protein
MLTARGLNFLAGEGARFVDFIAALTGGAGVGDGVVETLEQVFDQLAPLFPKYHAHLLVIVSDSHSCDRLDVSARPTQVRCCESSEAVCH